MGAWAGQETSVSVVLLPQTAPAPRIFYLNFTEKHDFDTGIDLKPGQTLVVYANTAPLGPEGALGCRSGAGTALPNGGTCGALAARIGDAPYFYVGPAFAGPVSRAGRLYFTTNDVPGQAVDSFGYAQFTVFVLDKAVCTAEPAMTITLNPGFYIAEVRTAPGAREGYWGMEVLAQKGTLSGGFNLGGALQESSTNLGFGAFYVPSRQTVRLKLDAQVLPGADPSKFSLAVRLLDSNRNPVGNEQYGAAAVQLERTVDTGFYIVEVRSPFGAPRATFQLGLNADAFSGGVDVGGFVTAGLVGFGAFYIPEAQEVKIRTLGLPSYDSVGASCLTLTLLDANRQVVRSAP